ncbi:hypothetical protein ACP70R_003142 [Stipagrostis hirtigluma subsp. patula]
MAASHSQRPRERTESTCTTATARATHAFKIDGYSLQKGLGQGKFIRSATFAVGGYDWCIRYYPEGNKGEDIKGHISVYLHLRSRDAEVRAMYEFRLLSSQATGLSFSVFRSKNVRVFKSRAPESPTWGVIKFMKKSELEASPYLIDDRLVIECDVTVILGKPVSKSDTKCEVQVPPSSLSDNLGKLLESEEGADVTFKVKGEVFHAHKLVLAMRSPVFKAELYGLMSDKESKSITIEDMEPAIFKKLLHFIYTDSLPAMDDLDRDGSDDIVKHLLVAADRYEVDRMKLICESILWKRLDLGSVAATLALADQHHCSQLKDACIRFINSSSRIGDVVASQGYEHLKRACPAIIVEIWEKSAKSRKI